MHSFLKIIKELIFYFVIYQNSKLFIVEKGILKEEASIDKLKFPLKIIFNHGTQLTIEKKSDLSSIRLLVPGFFEKEKELGEFYGVYYGQIGVRVKPDTMRYLTNDTIENCTTYNFETSKTRKSI